MNIGDYVIGTKEASREYSKTVEGWVGQIMNIRPNREDDLEVRGYNHAIDKLDTFSWVNSTYFKVIGTKTEPIDLNKIKEGDYIQAIMETDSYDNYHLVPGFIAKVVRSTEGDLIDENSTWDLSVELPDNESPGKMSPDWVNSQRFVRIVPLVEEESNSVDRRTGSDVNGKDLKEGDVIEILTPDCHGRITGYSIGDRFFVNRVDKLDPGLDIQIVPVEEFYSPARHMFWVCGKYVRLVNNTEKEKTKVAKKDHTETKFEIGSYVTAKETFCHDGEEIVKGYKYKITDYGRSRGMETRIQIDLGFKYWWVPKDKMILLSSSSGSIYTGTKVMLKIKDVIYSNPATIVFWDDGTKTVVRCGKDETFDPEKGLAMAISKRVLGSNYAWHGRFNKWLPKNRAEKNSKKEGENKKDE